MNQSAGPVVSVIVPHHLNECQEYLDLCLTSILNSEGIDFEVICAADTKEPPAVPPSVFLIHDEKLSTGSAKINHAVKLISPSSKYIMIVSDDVMLTKSCLATLVKGVSHQEMICNPISNSEYHSKLLNGISIVSADDSKRFDVPLKLTKEDIRGFEDMIYDLPSESVRLVPFPYVGFYSTLIPLSVWKRVGTIDETLDVRHNDHDYCMRAARLGIPSVINYGCFSLHFGDRTLPKCTSVDDYKKADDAFIRKWSIIQEDVSDTKFHQQ